MNALTPYMIWIKFVGILALCVACAVGGGVIVYDYLTAQFDAEKLQIEKDKNDAIEKKVSENAALLAAQQTNHAQEIEEYENRHSKDLAQIAANRAAIATGGLFVPRPVCRGLADGTQTAHAGQSDGVDRAAFELPAGIEAGLYNLESRADTEASELEAKLGLCQQFARDNGFAR